MQIHRRVASHDSRYPFKVHPKMLFHRGSLDSGAAAAVQQAIQDQIAMKTRVKQHCIGVRTLLQPSAIQESMSAFEHRRYMMLLCQQVILARPITVSHDFCLACLKFIT